MKFFKIKYNGEKVALSWTEHRVGGTEIEHNLHSGQTPAPDLPAALKKFERFVEELLEVPADWMLTLKVTGLSINEEEDDGREGLVITCQKKLANTNGPLVVNTPHLRAPIKLGEEGPGFFLNGMEEAIAEANRAAQLFVEGRRAQKELFEVTLTKDMKHQLELSGAPTDD
ncbi:MAG: hypothetical protein JWL97_2995 [Gemmatimonadales bacterium]|nr:hypothetical protein [Gemmatimonadales bacterium]